MPVPGGSPEDTHDTRVVTSHHNLGKAVVNAFELKAFLTGKPIDPPRQLLERNPDLASVCQRVPVRRVIIESFSSVRSRRSAFLIERTYSSVLATTDEQRAQTR